MADDTATYIDEEGNKQSGTVGTDYWQGIADNYKKLWEDQKAANEEAYRLSEEARQQQLDFNTQQQNNATAKLNRQLFINKAAAEKNLPQQLAAMGITGGMAETSRVGLETNYGSNLSANEQARLQAIAALQQQSGQAQLQAQLAKLQGDQDATTQYNANMLNLDTQRYSQERAQAEAAAAMKAKSGDYSGYVELGMITPDDAEMMKKLWIAQNPKLAQQLGYTQPSYSESGDQKPVNYEDLSDGAKLVVKAYASILESDKTLGNTSDMPAVLSNMKKSAASGKAGYSTADIAMAERYINGK